MYCSAKLRGLPCCLKFSSPANEIIMRSFTSSHQSENPLAGTRVLFANVPADGHFNPLTGLAVHLKNQGCDVRWYTSTTYEGKVKKLGIPFYGLKKAKDISASSDPDLIFPDRKFHKSQISKLKFDMVNVFVLRGPEYYEDIRAIHKDFPFDVMVADITFGAIPFVKERMNIPVVGVSVIPLPETSKDLPPAGLGLTPSYSVFGKIKQAALRFFADTVIFAQPNKVMRQVLGEYGIDAEGANIFDILIQKSTLVLQSGTPGFEYRRSDLSRHIHFAGPLLPYTRNKNEKRWYNEKLKTFDKVVLVTQGTVEKDVDKLLAPTLEAFRNSDVLVIVTTGGVQTKELRYRFPDQNFIIEDFIPFDDVMPYADVYVSNGGYGGVLLSIQNGLPMVVAGVHEGKNEINARVGYFKFGINLATEKPTPAQIRKAVSDVISNPEYVQKVNQLKEEFKTYRPGEILAKQILNLVPEKVKEEEEVYIY